jgi:plasmid stabilization system protein ParE
MTDYQLTSKAEGDLFAIWSFIARDNIDAADRVAAAIFDACAFLAAAPLRGHVHKDLTSLPVRWWTVLRYSNYVIVYDPAAKPLQILRILHGARNVSGQLKTPQ